MWVWYVDGIVAMLVNLALWNTVPGAGYIVPACRSNVPVVEVVTAVVFAHHQQCGD